MRILVLGAGLIGQAIVKDLAGQPDFRVTAVDQNPAALEGLPAQIKCVDLKTEDIGALASGFDLAVNAVPGSMGYSMLESLVLTGIRVVDIAFSPEDPFKLDSIVRKNNSLAVVDCGVAPGLCNILAGYSTTLLEELHSYQCYVGGLPVVRRWPYQYGAVFSPSDVIEEYIRPVYVMEDGKEVVHAPLSGLEWIDFPEVGTLEAFYTDGLRTLRYTMDFPDMYEKTLRYPGHAELMRVLRESGFFDPREMAFGGSVVKPLDMTTRLLRRQWELDDDEQDLTIMRVCVEGRKGNSTRHFQFDLFDTFDTRTGTTSMARTTGYTCTAVVRLIADGCDLQGVCPPEWLGRDPACFGAVVSYLKQRNVHFRCIEKDIPVEQHL